MQTIRNRWRRASLASVCALLTAGGIAVFTGGTAAAAIFVHCPADNLQTAMNAAPSGAMLIVSGTCIGNFTVPAGKSLTLDGPAVLDANHAGTALTVPITATAKLISITVQNGTLGGINNAGTLSAAYATIRTNINSVPGAAIVNTGTLDVTNSIITGNTARIGGGGVANSGPAAVATISASTIDHNNGGSTGGGIFNQIGGNFTLSSSFVTNNNGSSGGGIYNDLGSTLTVKGSHVNNNNQQSGGQGGGIFNAATATVNSTEVLGNTANQGGGVYNGAGSNMNLKSDSVVQNIATGGAGSGGGVRNLGALSFPGTTVAGNTPDNCVGC